MSLFHNLCFIVPSKKTCVFANVCKDYTKNIFSIVIESKEDSM